MASHEAGLYLRSQLERIGELVTTLLVESCAREISALAVAIRVVQSCCHPGPSQRSPMCPST